MSPPFAASFVRDPKRKVSESGANLRTFFTMLEEVEGGILIADFVFIATKRREKSKTISAVPFRVLVPARVRWPNSASGIAIDAARG